MGYYLQAIIGKESLAGGSRFLPARIVPLRQGLSMIPVTGELFDEIQAALPDEDEPLQRFEKLSAPVARWARDLSANGLIAYIEAEFFGGVGGQSAVAWRDGEVVLESVHSEDAINIALRLFGVEVGSEFDEFDAVGLGLHRSTEEWLTGNAI